MKSKEVWKDVSGYEGKYIVSNRGNVKRIDRIKDRILKPQVTPNGFWFVKLYSDNMTVKHCHLQDLVAAAFNDNPNNYRFAKHIDGNFKNNVPENLEWIPKRKRFKHGDRKENKYSGKKFIDFVLCPKIGNTVKVYGKHAFDDSRYGIVSGFFTKDILYITNGIRDYHVRNCVYLDECPQIDYPDFYLDEYKCKFTDVKRDDVTAINEKAREMIAEGGMVG